MGLGSLAFFVLSWAGLPGFGQEISVGMEYFSVTNPHFRDTLQECLARVTEVRASRKLDSVDQQQLRRVTDLLIQLSLEIPTEIAPGKSRLRRVLGRIVNWVIRWLSSE
jgi:hypothetical protein